jgi:hypothetical protein
VDELDSEALTEIYGEYVDIHVFRHTSSVVYCIISAYKARVKDISDLLTKNTHVDPINLEIRQIDLDSLFDF